jgi:cell division protein FtsW
MIRIKKNPLPAVTADLDYVLLLTAAVLTVMGMLMVFSSSVIMADARWRTPYLFVVKDIFWVLLGTAAMFFMANYDYRKLQKLAKPLIIIAVLLLVAVLVIGTVKGGAKRWLKIGPLGFQPSEFAKLVLVIALADFLDRRKSRMKNFKGLLPGLVIMGLLCLPIAVEPDLGTPLLMAAVGLSLLYAGGAKLMHILLLGASALPLVAIEILRKPYRLQRVKDFLASWGDIHSGSYQLNQSILALGNGGFLGRGLGQSQMKLNYLPEPHTDFIFPIIGEELGFIGTICLILLFLFFAWRGWQISRKSENYFGNLLAIGVTWLVIYQALINMAVACGVFPTKGMPLPFVSFGGTALLINLAEVGILLNIAKGKPVLTRKRVVRRHGRE